MNNYKYYRVREIRINSGESVFRVEFCETWIGVLFGLWSRSTREHRLLDGAKEKINVLASRKIRKISTVFKRTVK